jgi:hypothetical protein
MVVAAAVNQAGQTRWECELGCDRASRASGVFAADLLASGHEPSLETFRPDDDEIFGLRVTAFIGPNDRGGEDEFDFFVCSLVGSRSIHLKRGSRFFAATSS